MLYLSLGVGFEATGRGKNINILGIPILYTEFEESSTQDDALDISQ